MKFIAFVITIFCLSALAQEKSTWQNFKEDFAAPLHDGESKQVLVNGALLAATFAAKFNSDQSLSTNARDYSQEHPIMDHRTSRFADLMGQTIPNVLYISWFGLTDSDKDQSRKRASLMFRATLHSGIMVNIMKRTFNDPRPNGRDNYSFPSGHSSTAFAFAGVVAHEHALPYGIAAYSLATLVALSRIQDDMHYMHDVTFGAALGISYATALYNKNNKNSDSAWFMIPVDNGSMLSWVKNY